MNSRTMIALDTSERAHVIDVRTEEELEVCQQEVCQKYLDLCKSLLLIKISFMEW